MVSKKYARWVSTLGVILVTLAAFSSYGATFIETCTQGAADSLGAGPILSIPLYIAGFALLIRYPLERWGWLFMVPAIGLIAYQTYWTAHFFTSHVFYNVSACDVITGEGPVAFDGREKTFLVIWISMSLLALGGIIVALSRTRRASAR